MKTRLRNNKGQFKKESKVSEFGFVNLSTYTSPEVKEVNGADWIEYGADNNYFQYLIDRYNGSPTNNAAINGISQAIYGKGLNATNSSAKPNEYAQMVSLFKKDVVRKLCYDLKLMGQCAVQVIYSKDRKTIAQLEHMPVETLRAEKCDDKGDIPAYYYYKDWANIKRTDNPLRIPAYGMSKENIEIFYIKPYKSGFYYYSPVDYQGGLQYAELEEEVSNYHLNNILNGLAPSMLINFNNGTPNQQERQLIEQKIAQKFSGTSNAGKFILAFNDNKESQAEITPVQLSDAHNQYQFLSEESQSKIQVAHRVVSPFLLGIRTSSGFSSNSDEIKTASLLMDNTVIRPFQELLIDSFDELLAYNEISLNLYFTTLQPLEFTEVDSSIQDKETIEEETGVETVDGIDTGSGVDVISENVTEDEIEKVDASYNGAQISSAISIIEKVKEGILTPDQAKTFLIQFLQLPENIANSFFDNDTINLSKVKNYLESKRKKEVSLESFGEDEDLTEWELIDERKVDYEDEDALDYQIDQLNTKDKSLLSKIWNFVSTGTARPNAKSSQDEDVDGTQFKVRYQYAPLKDTFTDGKNVTRDFCQKMVTAKKIYRKEDIEMMSKQAVNAGWGPRGADTYSIWFYKGGGACHHFWMRKTYMKKGKGSIDINSPLAPTVSVNQARKAGFKPEKNSALVAKRPIDMPNEGFLPTNKRR
tara:strand:- start:874 stop:2982 length:2109 start_codon:yes stop_codon:yes gene_type:complete